MNRLVYLKNVVTLKLDPQKCVGCGMCTLVCPHAVLILANGKVQIDNRDACMECGACSTNCPVEAITVQAGVGCAAAVINTALGRKNTSCCCVSEPKKGSEKGPDQSTAPFSSTCC
ncbi:MAG: mercury methylation ferredoxin HgcB [Desulfatiglandales bacterium]|jgi:ferredoxin